MEDNYITGSIIESAIKVHKHFGPGLFERVYERCLASELIRKGFNVKRQVELPVIYNDEIIEFAYKLDLLINDRIIVEIKAVDAFHPIYKSQLLTYLKLSNCKIGLLINFNTKILKDGIIRLINYPFSVISINSFISVSKKTR